MSYEFGPRLLAELGSGAVTCHMAPNLASRLSWAPVLPRVLRLWTSPPDWGGLAVLPVQVSTRVPNTHAQISKAYDMACMTCGQAAQSIPARHVDS
jgi:hypothetical protein